MNTRKKVLTMSFVAMFCVCDFFFFESECVGSTEEERVTIINAVSAMKKNILAGIQKFSRKRFVAVNERLGKKVQDMLDPHDVASVPVPVDPPGPVDPLASEPDQEPVGSVDPPVGPVVHCGNTITDVVMEISCLIYLVKAVIQSVDYWVSVNGRGSRDLEDVRQKLEECKTLNEKASKAFSVFSGGSRFLEHRLLFCKNLRNSGGGSLLSFLYNFVLRIFHKEDGRADGDDIVEFRIFLCKSSTELTNCVRSLFDVLKNLTGIGEGIMEIIEKSTVGIDEKSTVGIDAHVIHACIYFARIALVFKDFVDTLRDMFIAVSQPVSQPVSQRDLENRCSCYDIKYKHMDDTVSFFGDLLNILSKNLEFDKMIGSMCDIYRKVKIKIEDELKEGEAKVFLTEEDTDLKLLNKLTDNRSRLWKFGRFIGIILLTERFISFVFGSEKLWDKLMKYSVFKYSVGLIAKFTGCVLYYCTWGAVWFLRKIVPWILKNVINFLCFALRVKAEISVGITKENGNKIFENSYVMGFWKK